MVKVAYKYIAYFIGIITVLVLLFDLYLWMSGSVTISQMKILWSKDLLVVPFAWGFLMGHWFG